MFEKGQQVMVAQHCWGPQYSFVNGRGIHMNSKDMGMLIGTVIGAGDSGVRVRFIADDGKWDALYTFTNSELVAVNSLS